MHFRQWPYIRAKLKDVNFDAIIEEGEPWTDPEFPPNSTSLFINGKSHAQAEKKELKRKWEDYTWMRASEFFNFEKFCLFKSIEPEDVKQGNCDNAHLLATLAGLAERDMTVDAGKSAPGKCVRDLFITRKINAAGCYAMKFIINGEETIVVVDDYLPIKQSKCNGG